ncbi:hypothetical protein V7654_13615 [Bacillus sp. JJ1609]|uniref:hypothetical protein n=1 Tax=Bacillus sp. JJ1609 TaxID=3122977 RepID=UPI002FFDF332
MNKKVKWSVISVSTATALTFGGLVVDHQNKNLMSSTSEINTFRDQPSSFSEDDWDDDDFFSEDEESDEDSSWGQDRYQPAPRRGYEHTEVQGLLKNEDRI